MFTDPGPSGAVRTRDWGILEENSNIIRRAKGGKKSGWTVYVCDLIIQATLHSVLYCSYVERERERERSNKGIPSYSFMAQGGCLRRKLTTQK